MGATGLPNGVRYNEYALVIGEYLSVDTVVRRHMYSGSRGILYSPPPTADEATESDADAAAAVDDEPERVPSERVESRTVPPADD